MIIHMQYQYVNLPEAGYGAAASEKMHRVQSTYTFKVVIGAISIAEETIK